MLESALYTDNAFVTLTYRPETVPWIISSEHGPKQSLVPKDLTDWLKRFRKSLEPIRVRYFAVGEYGDESQRPHYHVALFGYPGCRYGLSRYALRPNSCCDVCDKVRDTWGKGQIYIGMLGIESAQYVAGYTTKKLTDKDDKRLFGRHPEFARMSKCPGIGHDFMYEVASSFMQFNLENSQTDVPSGLRHGGRILPLGRYLRKRLRVMVGRDEKAPQASLDEQVAELQALRDYAFDTSQSFKEVVKQEYKGKSARVETLSRIHKQRRSI